MSDSVYPGVDHQPIQTTVFNQQATALPGDLPFPAEPNLLEMCPVGETDGVLCGRIISGRPVSSLWPTGEKPPMRTGISATGIMTLTHGETDTDDGTVADAVGDIYGAVVRPNSARTNANGLPYFRYNEIATILRKGANGRRIWVDCGAVSNMAVTDTLRVVSIVGVTEGTLYQVGTVCNSAAPDTCTTIDISSIARVVAGSVLCYTDTSSVAHYMCMIEWL